MRVKSLLELGCAEFCFVVKCGSSGRSNAREKAGFVYVFDAAGTGRARRPPRRQLLQPQQSTASGIRAAPYSKQRLLWQTMRCLCLRRAVRLQATLMAASEPDRFRSFPFLPRTFQVPGVTTSKIFLRAILHPFRHSSMISSKVGCLPTKRL